MMPKRTLLLGVLGAAFGSSSALAEEAPQPEKIRWGMGAKVRRWYAPPLLQQLFVEDSPGLASNDGAGLDFARRTGNVEVAFGFGFDRLDGRDGYYVEKGGDPTVPGNVDYVTFHDLQWFTAEVTVASHARIHKFLEFRYGAGLGLGLVRGEMRKTDSLCTSDRLAQDCMPDPAGVEVDQPADIPPVLPVVNVLLGMQLVPFDFLHLHVDIGFHSVPYVGAGATLYLW